MSYEAGKGDMNDQEIDKLINELDKVAKDCDVYEFGLPIGTIHHEQLRQAVRDWLFNQSDLVVIEQDEITSVKSRAVWAVIVPGKWSR